MSWADWLRKPLAALGGVDKTRWVVLDVETSGLDPIRDQLLAIAAIAVQVDWAGRALAVDLGMLIKARSDAQRNADAASLAGASAFQNNKPQDAIYDANLASGTLADGRTWLPRMYGFWIGLMSMARP